MSVLSHRIRLIRGPRVVFALRRMLEAWRRGEAVADRGSPLATALARVLRECIAVPELETLRAELEGRTPAEVVPMTPVWDDERRQLWAGRELVKEFGRPSPMLIAILRAFQELNWPIRMDDPRPRERVVNAAQTLRNAIKRLNGCQGRHVIRFRADGTGQGIRWEWVEE